MDNQKSYKLALIAFEDLERLWLFGFHNFGEQQADNYYFGLIKQFEKIAKHPLMYPEVNHIRKGYRRSVYYAHSIYFRYRKQAVEIMRIINRNKI